MSIILADQYTDPIKPIANASKEIAEGKLVRIRDNKRRDEIGVLVKSFNEMVEKLSERKELEEKLKKTEQLSMIGQLASGIAHEVRNPLNFSLPCPSGTYGKGSRKSISPRAVTSTNPWIVCRRRYTGSMS